MPIVNVDIKQLEVCLAAQESQDKLLCRLLNDGVDIHRFIGSFIYEQAAEEISNTDRTAVKKGVFGILYGNGANKLAINTGRSVDWCKEFIEQFYTLFPGIKEWHQRILKDVERVGSLKLWDGVVLKFNKYPAKYEWQKAKGIKESYNPPDIKNHPIQHLSFVIVSILLSSLYREKAIYKRDKYLIINTVHDSIMLDCKSEDVGEAIQDVFEIVDKLPNNVLNLFGVKLLVPIKVDIEVGNNWYDLKSININ